MKNVILDTDFGTDPGDMGGVLIALAMHKAKLINLLGIINSTSVDKAPGAVSAACHSFGLSNIPVGTWKGASIIGGYVANNWTDQAYDNVAFPRTGGLAATFEDCLTLYQRLLTENSKVTIVALGGGNALNQLLVASPTLCSTKVFELLWAAGHYPIGAAEYNIGSLDYPSAAAVMSNWPTKITYSGYEVGLGVFASGALQFEYTNADVGRFAYNAIAPTGRDSWDQMPFFWLVYGRSLFRTVSGSNVGLPSSGNTWTTSPSGKDQYIVKTLGNTAYAWMVNAWMGYSRSGVLPSWKYGHGIVSI